QVERRLAVEYQSVHASLDVNDAGNMLLRVDDIPNRLGESDHSNVDRTSRQTVELAAVEGLDGSAASNSFRVGRPDGSCPACGKSKGDPYQRGQLRLHGTDAANPSACAPIPTATTIEFVSCCLVSPPRRRGVALASIPHSRRSVPPSALRRRMKSGSGSRRRLGHPPPVRWHWGSW
ncbi:MAG: hypothetical protein QOI23_1524, partial [Chloroflexota bacterium]|nr:hypothetical protein [Chloroflexota bacterium]